MVNLFSIETMREFRDYVHSFYGKDEIYDLGVSVPDIEQGIVDYVEELMNNPKITWGGGDSIDRERVRYILESKGFSEVA